MNRHKDGWRRSGAVCRRSVMKAALLASGAAMGARLVAKGPASTLPDSLAGFAPGSFTIDPASALGARMRVNAAYLLSLDIDRLVYSFRRYARLSTRGAKPYGGWEAPNWGTRGHIPGHYLSAISKAALTTARSDPSAAATFRARSEAMVAALAECQTAMARLEGPDGPGHSGYLNTQSPAQFDRLEALQPCDVPYYQIHKIMAGLVDAYTLLGNTQALGVASGMADYFTWRMDRLPAERIDAITETRRYKGQEKTFFMEFGGMHDVLLSLHRITGNPAHRRLADHFDRLWFRSMLVEDRDELGQNAQHANTELANVLGLARYHELSRAPEYRAATLNFLGWMARGHQFANGAVSGTSAYPRPLDYGAELFGSPGLLYRQVVRAPSTRGGASTSGADHRECGESCCSHNLNRLAGYAIRWTGDGQWGDHFENRFVNAVLAQQHPKTGMFVYNLNLAPGSTKRFGTREDSFWCCYGSGMEAFASPADNAFFHDGDRALWVNNYVPGTLDWREAGVRLVQNTAFPADGRVHLRVETATPRTFALHLRVPGWAKGARLVVNGRVQRMALAPGQFAEVRRRWAGGDTVQLTLPFALRTEPLPDRPDMVSVHYGPHLLVACGPGKIRFDGDVVALIAGMAPGSAPNSFHLPSSSGTTVYRPISAIVDESYSGYTELLRSPQEQVRDALIVGDPSSHAAHRMSEAGLVAGEEHGARWIETARPLELMLAVDPMRPTYLKMRYWGDDTGSGAFARLFDIRLLGPGGGIIATQSLAREAPGGWHDVLYPLPEAVTRGRRVVALRLEPKGFEGLPGRAGRFFDRIQTHSYA